MILAVSKHPVCILRMILQKTLAALSLLGTELERPQTNFDEFQKLVQVENSTKCFEQISGTTCTSLGQEAKLLMKLRLGLSASGKKGSDAVRILWTFPGRKRPLDVSW